MVYIIKFNKNIPNVLVLIITSKSVLIKLRRFFFIKVWKVVMEWIKVISSTFQKYDLSCSGYPICDGLVQKILSIRKFSSCFRLNYAAISS
jgi:hypothetical protein